MSKSWFYLTLWRGTPPEFTDEFDARIDDEDSAISSIETANTLGTVIDTALNALVSIETKEDVNTEIITKMEVVWYVG